MNAVLLAGGISRGALYEATKEENKSLIDINGLPMAGYVVRALRAAGMVEGIALVGPASAGDLGADRMAAGEDTLLGNVNLGLSLFPDDEYILLATADIPLLTPAAVDAFIAEALAVKADIVYPMVSRATCEARFPGQKRTYVRLREGSFTGGNLMLVNSAFIRKEQALVQRVFDLRKEPLRLAGLLGFSLVLRFLLGWAALADIEGAAGRLINGSARGLAGSFPEIAFDVDKPSDLQLVRQELNGGENED